MLEFVVAVALALIGVALVVAFVRLSLGPRLEDRIVAMDLIAVLTVGMIVAATAGNGQRSLLDAASLIALVGFLGTVAYAWYLQQGESK